MDRSMTAGDICQRAADLVGGDRAATHGPKEKNHQNIAVMWNAYLSIRPDPDAPISELDVAIMMNQMKVSRTQTGKHNPDDYVDMAGYAGVAGEIAGGDR